MIDVDEGKTKMKTPKGGEPALYTKSNGKWYPAEEFERSKIAAEVGPLEAAAIAADRSVDRAVNGLKNIAGFGKDKAEKANDQMHYDSLAKEHPIATTAGTTLSEIAQIALPGGVVGKGITKLAPKATKMPGTVNALSDLIASTGTAALRGDDVAKEGMMSLLGSGVGAILKPLAKGFNITEDAAKLADEGVDYSIGQSVTNPVVSNIDSFFRNFVPGAAGTAVRHGETIARDFHKVPLRKAALPGTPITETGRRGANQAFQGYVDAYNRAWSLVDEIPTGAVDNATESLRKGIMSVGSRDGDALSGLAEEVADIYKKHQKGGISAGEAANMIDRAMAGAIEKSDSYKLNKIIASAKNGLRETYPGSVSRILDPIDARYPSMSAVNEAAKSAKTEGGRFSPDQLLEAGDRTAKNKFGYLEGTNPLQEIAEAGSAVHGRHIPEVPILQNFISWLRPNIPDSWVKQGTKAATGRFGPQKKAAEIFESMANQSFLPGAGNLGANSDSILDLIRMLTDEEEKKQ